MMINYKILLNFFLLLSVTSTLYAQEITGEVMDKNGNPMAGVFINNKMNKENTMSLPNGTFKIKAKTGDQLNFDFIGFSSLTKTVTGDKLKITLQEKEVGLEELVVIGSRNKSRTSVDTPVPVDVLEIETLKTSAPQVTLTEILNYAAPSFSSNPQSISDGTDHIAPASLRGLGPDQVLVLVNGKRRHKTSLINVNGTFGRGSVGSDLSTIPSESIKRIEILRDGAAAQYGSDAIAGVINIVLKDSTGKLEIDLTSGINSTSEISPDNDYDGEKLNLGINYGIPIGNKGGFINFTGTFNFRGETNRMQEWKGSIFNKYNTVERLALAGGKDPASFSTDVNELIHPTTEDTRKTVLRTKIINDIDPYLSGADFSYSSTTLTDEQKMVELRDGLSADNTTAELTARNMKRSDFNMRVGQSRLRAAQFWANMEIPFDVNTAIYAFGGISYKAGNAAGFYRLPNQSRTYTPVYPNGFLPNINSSITDRALTVGIRGKIGDWDIDFSNTYGINRFDYRITNSSNASLVSSTPTSAYSGGYSYSENTSNINMSHFYDDILEGFNVAFGGEFRLENYQIFSGEELSYSQYNTKGNVHDPTDPDSKVPVTFVTSKNEDGTFSNQTRAGGIQVFPGFRPENEINAVRSSVAGYLDLELDITKSFMLGSALRFENFSDFGNTLNYKIVSRVKLSDKINLRGGIQTGFRAPSLHQIYYGATNTLFVDGIPTETGTFPNNSRIAKILGIRQLTAETSLGYSFGLATKIPTANLKLTIDGYLIGIDDRVILTGSFGANNNPELVRIFSQANAGTATFFANTVNTSTKGLDIVIDHNIKFPDLAKLTNTLSLTFSATTVEGVNIPKAVEDAGLKDTYFDASGKLFLESAIPSSKGSLSHNFVFNQKWNFYLRNSYFGAVKEAENNLDSNIDFTHDAKIITDLTVGYNFNSNIKLTVGSNNILDIYPDVLDVSRQSSGRFIYSRRSVQFGTNGRYVFARLNISI